MYVVRMLSSRLLVGWLRTNLVLPAKQLTLHQLVTAAIFGVWGGIFPVPVTTTAALLALIWSGHFFPAIKFNVPMTTLACAINIAVIPLDLLLLPHFIRGGCLAIGRSAEEMGCALGTQFVADVQAAPVATLQVYVVCFAAAAGLWTCMTPFVMLLCAMISSKELGGSALAAGARSRGGRRRRGKSVP